jgi:hypothetical protein
MLLKYLLAEWVYLYKAYSLYPCPFTSKGKPADTAKEVEMLHYAPPSSSGLTLSAFRLTISRCPFSNSTKALFILPLAKTLHSLPYNVARFGLLRHV